MKVNFYSYSVLFLFISFSFFACTNEQNRQKKDKKSLSADSIQPKMTKEKITRIKKIFYTLPSPLDLTYLFKKEGIEYQAEKLHNPERRSDYELTTKKALNLGVYGADLSYAGLFGQHQDAIKYYTTTQLMAEDLGIGQTFQKEFVSRLEKNANNKDTLLQVVSEFFLENDSYLKNQNQQDISTYILTGGWIEGLYLGTQMADKNSNVSGIQDVIIGQRFSIDNLIILLENLNDKRDSEAILKSIKELDQHFDEIQEVEIEVTAEKKNGLLEVKSEGEQLTLSDSTFNKIKNKVAVIRANIIE